MSLACSVTEGSFLHNQIKKTKKNLGKEIKVIVYLQRLRQNGG